MGPEHDTSHGVVILGGGFGGLNAARTLGRAGIRVTLVDKRNFHLFQPLLYQVATGGLSPGDISSPLRAVLKRHRRTHVRKGEVIDLDPAGREVIFRGGRLGYDTLIVATGVSHDYFGNDEWEDTARGLKSVEDALEIRRRIFTAYEAAEIESDPETRRAWMTFVVVGGGPTGVELAGALAELAHGTLKNDFRVIDPRESTVYLLEGMERVLPPYPPDLSGKACRALQRLRVTVRTGTLVTNIDGSAVTLRRGESEESIEARTVLWAAGVRASSLGRVLAEKTGAELDRAGRVRVGPDLSIANHPEIFVIGDLASFTHQGGTPLPGTAPVAMQQGHYAATRIRRALEGKTTPPFHYRDKGKLAVIGRHAAVADFGTSRFAGFPAWIAWIFVHLWYLIEFDNKVLVLIQWAFHYFTRRRGARLITGELSESRAYGPEHKTKQGKRAFNRS
jgi:NADH dehydrogenase